MEKFNIDEQWILQNIIANQFEDGVGGYRSSKIECIKYFKDKVEVVYTDGQSLVFTITKN